MEDTDGMTTTVEQGLREAVAAARAEVADVLLKIDDLLLQQIPQIRAEWECAIGVYQTDLLKAQLTARRAKRRLELAQASANRGEDPDGPAIDAMLDRELEEWQDTIKERMEEYVAAVTRQQSFEPLTPAEERELKRLHRELIRRLHPDVNPGEEDSCLALFMAAQRAYREGDLATLRSLEVATRGMGADAQKKKDELAAASPDELEIELASTQAQFAVLKERLEDITSTEPYTWRDLLADANWVLNAVAELKGEAEGQRQIKADYDARYQEQFGGKEQGDAEQC